MEIKKAEPRKASNPQPPPPFGGYGGSYGGFDGGFGPGPYRNLADLGGGYRGFGGYRGGGYGYEYDSGGEYHARKRKR